MFTWCFTNSSFLDQKHNGPMRDDDIERNIIHYCNGCCTHSTCNLLLFSIHSSMGHKNLDMMLLFNHLPGIFLAWCNVQQNFFGVSPLSVALLSWFFLCLIGGLLLSERDVMLQSWMAPVWVSVRAEVAVGDTGCIMSWCLSCKSTTNRSTFSWDCYLLKPLTSITFQRGIGVLRQRF